MEEFRPQLEPHYYDEHKYGSYLEQLGVRYPTVRPGSEILREQLKRSDRK